MLDCGLLGMTACSLVVPEDGGRMCHRNDNYLRLCGVITQKTDIEMFTTLKTKSRMFVDVLCNFYVTPLVHIKRLPVLFNFIFVTHQSRNMSNISSSSSCLPFEGI
jgi:hypothetical protein